MGQRQHVVRDAWRAWCLRRHMASERRDTQLDCFHDAAGYFHRIDWHATLSSLLPVRKLGPWLVVPLFPPLLLVVGCLIVLLPCAFGRVALSLARSITLLGSVLFDLVISPNLPSFYLLGMVGSLLVKIVTLILCVVGWFMCKRFFGPLFILDLCLFVSWS